ncbi:hypothetical protein, partial [Galactobacter valiniphilus]|uniref:hypothetical protein n=1 Tax=Galactobacter valiniphilus TaxID=2676122 RepID=UPI0037367DEF
MSWGLISEMGHVAIQTTDLAGSLFDATQLLGLRETDRADGQVYLSANAVHHELVYVESSRNGIHSLGLIARDGDALKEIRRR